MIKFNIPEDQMFKATMVGANGYILKNESPLDIHIYLEELMDGGAPTSPLIARKSLNLIKKRPH